MGPEESMRIQSNLGSDIILDGIENGEISESARENVTMLLRNSFRPEFLNRIDETVFYKPLTRENIGGIIELLIDELRARLEGRQLKLRITDKAKEYIADEGYDPQYGARPLKRFLQSRVETLAAKLIIAKDPAPGSTLVIDYDGNELTGDVE